MYRMFWNLKQLREKDLVNLIRTWGTTGPIALHRSRKSASDD